MELLDVDCVAEMAKYHGKSDLLMSQSIKEVCFWQCDILVVA